MRKLIIIAGVILLVLIAVIAVALLNLNSLINRNKDYLLAQAEETLGRKVAVGNVGVTLWGGLGVRLNNFSLTEDPSFSKEEFVRAADLQVNVALLPLFRKELQVTRFILNRPVINVIRDQKGEFNFSSIGGDKKDREKTKKKKEPSERAEPLPLLISLVDVDDGELHYVDRNKGIDFRATKLDLNVKEISFDRPINIELAAAVLGADKQNFKIKGHLGPLGRKVDWNDLPIEGDIEVDQLRLENVEKALPAFKKSLPQGLDLVGLVGAKAQLSGKLGKGVLPKIKGSINLNGISAKLPQLPQPITDLNAKINFTGERAELAESPFRLGKSQIRLAAQVQSFSPLTLTYRLSSPELMLGELRPTASGRKKPEIMRDLKSEGRLMIKNGALSYQGKISSPSGTIADGDYSDLQTAASFAGRVVTIESLSLRAFDGSLQGNGRYELSETSPRFTLASRIQSMDLTQIFRSLISGPQNIQGRINLELNITGSGKEWDTIEKTLKGQGKTEVNKGALLDINIAESVLSAGTGLPGLVSLVPPQVRNKYPSIFNSKNTEFNELKGSVTIKDGKAYTDDLVISAAEFETRGKGWFGFDRTVDFNALLLISQQLSEDIISRAKEAKHIANQQGRIEMPFSLAGKLPGAKPKPDLGYLARSMQRGAFEKGLDSLFRKRGPKGATEPSPMQEGQPSQTERKKRDPTEDVLRGLKGLFGK